MTQSKILYPELSYRLTGIFYKVHRNLGRFCRERQYADALEDSLNTARIPYNREAIIEAPGGQASGNRLDFIINDQIIVDIKAKKFVTKEDYFQMQRYLQAAELELGLIVNFRNTYLKPKRILNTRLYSEHSDGY